MSQHKTLYITNGDSAVGGMRSAGFAGDFLPIRDALHVGPLNKDDDFLSNESLRCQFIIQQQWAPAEKVYELQAERREVLKNLHQYSSIQLWFEHDLYDQLQLIWVLKFLAEHQVDPNRVKLVVTDLFLGYAQDTDFFELLRFQEGATFKHYELATDYWLRLTSNNPNDWLEMVKVPHGYFPFMPQTILRFCQEFPSAGNGLSLTAQRLLIHANKPCTASQLFSHVQHQELAAFMGDTQFFKVLYGLHNSQFPLLQKHQADHGPTSADELFIISDLGREVLENKTHYQDLVAGDYWLGGVHIHAGNLWCYNVNDHHFERRSQ